MFSQPSPRIESTLDTRPRLELDLGDEIVTTVKVKPGDPDRTTQLDSDSDSDSGEESKPEKVVVKSSGQTTQLKSDSDSDSGEESKPEKVVVKRSGQTTDLKSDSDSGDDSGEDSRGKPRVDVDSDNLVVIPKSARVAKRDSDSDSDDESRPKPKIKPKQGAKIQAPRKTIHLESDSDDESKKELVVDVPLPPDEPEQPVVPTLPSLKNESGQPVVPTLPILENNKEQQPLVLTMSLPLDYSDQQPVPSLAMQQEYSEQENVLTFSLPKAYEQENVLTFSLPESFNQEPILTFSLPEDEFDQQSSVTHTLLEDDTYQQPVVTVPLPEEDDFHHEPSVTVPILEDDDEQQPAAMMAIPEEYSVQQRVPLLPSLEYDAEQQSIPVQIQDEDAPVSPRHRRKMSIPLDPDHHHVGSEPQRLIKQDSGVVTRQFQLDSDSDTETLQDNKPHPRHQQELEFEPETEIIPVLKPITSPLAKGVITPLSDEVTTPSPESKKKPAPEPEPEPKPEVKPLADLKLFAMDPDIPGAYIELNETDYDLMEELGEVNYSLKTFVHCHLVTYCNETVWSAGEYEVTDPESISCDPISGQITINSTKKGVMYRADGSGKWQYVSSFNYVPDFREILRPELAAKEKTPPRETIPFDHGKSEQIKASVQGPPIFQVPIKELFKLFTHYEDFITEMDNNDYQMITEGYETDFEFKPDKKCTEIKFDNKSIWRKGDHDISVPTSISYNEEGTQVTIRDGKKEVIYQRDQLGAWNYQSTARYDIEYTPLSLIEAITGSPDYRTDFAALFRQPVAPTAVTHDMEHFMPATPATGTPPTVQAAQRVSFQLFTDDVNDVTTEMDSNDYQMITEGYETDFEFKPDKKCTEIKFDNKSIWRKGDHDISVPTSISYNEEGTQVTIRDGEKAIILIKNQFGEWNYQTTARYHYDFDSAYHGSYHDQDFRIIQKMKKVLTQVDLKTDTRSAVEYDYREENKKKKITYTTKPGYEFGTVKFGGLTIWQTNHRDGFCSEVIFNNLSSKVKNAILKMDNGTQKEFIYIKKKWEECLPAQPRPQAPEAKDDDIQILDRVKSISEMLETDSEAETDAEEPVTGHTMFLSESESESTDTEELGSGIASVPPQSSPGTIVQIPQLAQVTTVETPETSSEVSTQPALISGITMTLSESEPETTSADTSQGVSKGKPEPDVQSHKLLEGTGGITMDLSSSDSEFIVEKLKRPSAISVQRPQSDVESSAGAQRGSMIPDPNYTHNALCKQLNAENVSKDFSNGLFGFNSKFVDMTLWSRRYGNPNITIPILSRSLYALLFNSGRWDAQYSDSFPLNTKD